MNFNNRFLIITLLIFFIISSLTNVILLKKIVGLLFIFFIPGYLISLIFYKKIYFLERLVYSVVMTVPLIISLILFLNIVLKIEFSDFFLIILFSISTFPALLKIKPIIQIKKKNLKLDKLSKIFLVYIILSLLIRIFLFLKIGTILGTDVGRFASISHALYLKKNIVANLQPYDMATGYFYFPGLFVILILMELIGINSVDGITIISFLFIFVSILMFYLIARKFLDRKRAIHATFFYSFLFDILLNLAIFGTFSYSFGVFYFFMLCLIFLEMFFENKKRFFILILSIVGLLSFHFYAIFPLIVFLVSLFTYEFVNEKKFFVKGRKIIYELVKASIIAVIFLSPFFLSFGEYAKISFARENVVDLMSFASKRERLPFHEKILTLLLTADWGSIFSTIFTKYSSIFILGFLSFLILVRKYIKDKKAILVYLFIYLTLHNYIFFSNFNLLRGINMMWMIFPVNFSFFLTNPVLNVAVLPIFYFVQSPSPLYLINILSPIEQQGVIPSIVWSEHAEAMNFIKVNTPKDSIFLIDGGGAGCTGASADYGDRIFPLTSRKIFYFTDYCWAEYNKTEYRKRVDIYRRISIYPDDSAALAALKKYNVTHVFIGPNHIGFDPELFSDSINYELMYNESKFQIFKIN